MNNERLYKLGSGGKVGYVKQREHYMPKALAKMIYEPKFTGFTSLQKAMAMDELEHARAACRALMIAQIREKK